MQVYRTPLTGESGQISARSEAHTIGRKPTFNNVFHALCRLRIAFGVDKPWRDACDANASGAQLHAEGAGQCVDCAFGGAINVHLWIGAVGQARADIDDNRTSVHNPDSRLRGKQQHANIEVEMLIETFSTQLLLWSRTPALGLIFFLRRSFRQPQIFVLVAIYRFRYGERNNVLKSKNSSERKRRIQGDPRLRKFEKQ